jgi:hypothetical protein
VVYTFFMMKKRAPGTRRTCSVHLVPASSKLKVKHRSPVPDKVSALKSKYIQRKKMAELYTLHYLTEVIHANESMCAFYRTHKKKDDLADSFLMTMYHCEK